MDKAQIKDRTIDRSLHEPAYRQLVSILKEQVSRGIFKPGSRLPSESHLRKVHGVSPMTVRRAINLLLDEGVVSTIQGKGTFVKALDFGAISFNLSQFQQLFTDDARTTVKFLEVKIIRADDKISEALCLEPGQRVVVMDRLIYRDDVPLMYHRGHLLYDPTQPIVEREMELTSLHGLFSGKGDSSFKKGKLKIVADSPDRDKTDLLRLEPATPVLRLEHLFFDFDDRPVSWGWFHFSSDLFCLQTSIGLWD